jgi:hypothetical protein
MKKYILIITIIMSVLFVQCRDNDEDPDQEQFKVNVFKDIATAEQQVNNMYMTTNNNLQNAEGELSGKSLTAESCATITINPFDYTTFPKTIIVDYGTSNCLCEDGNYRRGKLNITITGWLKDSGAVYTTIPENYYVNNQLVQGQHIITNLGRDANQHWTYKVDADANITVTNGIIHHTVHRNNSWIAGDSTLINKLDDEWLVSGNGSGTTTDDTPYTYNIVTPLLVKGNCQWITAGILQVNCSGITVNIDFGNGECDGISIVSYNGQNYTIQ